MESKNKVDLKDNYRKWYQETIYKINKIQKSKHFKFFCEFAKLVSQGDNFSEQWGGVRYLSKKDVLGVFKSIRERSLFDVDNYYDSTFMEQIILPAFDLLIEHKLIEIEGYMLD